MHQDTILIIDDELSIRESLSMFFTDEGYRVLTAENGDAGLEIFFSESVDIVVTDLRMPVKDGIEVMTEIQDHSPDTPMIVISGAGRRDDVIKALRMGAKDYITKPIEDIDMISHVVHKVLENKRLKEENRRYRLRLEKSEARYRTITEQIAEGVFTVDAEENLTFTNQAFCDMLGYPAQDMALKNLKNLTPPDSFDVILRQTQLRKEGATSRYEIRMMDKNQRPVHVELACSPLLDDQNRYAGSIAVVRDITKLIELRKKYQHFLREQAGKSKDMLAICANCKAIRDKEQGWMQMEDYFMDLVFSHGICPDCCVKLYPDLDLSDLEEENFDI